MSNVRQKSGGEMIKNIKNWIKSASIWFAIVVALVYIFMACVTGIVAMGLGWYNFIFGEL